MSGITEAQIAKDGDDVLKIDGKKFCEAFKPFGEQVIYIMER